MFNELFWMAAADAAQESGSASWFGYFIILWGIFCITIGLYFGIKYRGTGYKVYFDHFDGLPFANVKCRIRMRSGALVFDHGAINVTLPMNQIMDMNVTEKEHFNTQVVSDSGAAIGGAMDLGSWGAYAGGSPKLKEFKTYSYVLFITYRNSEGEIKQILFDVAKSPSKARQLVRKCKKYYTPQKVNYTL
jgi:hypothetical protein